MNTDLLERDTSLAVLDLALSDALAGNGQVVLVSGEAGIGKTTLVERFSQQNREAIRVLRGTSDPLLISHPFCSLHDMARQLPDSKLGEMLWEARQLEILYYFLEILQEAPTVVVFEDVHWADEATLELLSFLGRRIDRMRCLMIATYRDDELTLAHPLRPVLGHFTGKHVQRLHLEPLSEPAVVEWVKSAGHSADGFYEATGGNPFFVTEMLASGPESIPQSVSEAVLARMAPLSADARNIVEVAALIPKESFALDILKGIWDVPGGELEAAIASGILRLEDDLILFRHDLARHAVIDSMSALRQKLLHTLILGTLVRLWEEQRRVVGLPQIVHHARLAGDWKAVIQFAPQAAAEAINFGAHRQAAAYYQMMLEHADTLAREDHAQLLDQLAYECYLTGQIDEAARLRQEALAIWRDRADLQKEGENLRWLSRLHWFLGDREAAERYAVLAIEVLEQSTPGPELAMAYSNRAQLHMLAYEDDEAIRLGQQAVRLAEEYEAPEILAHALNNVGTAQLHLEDMTGQQNLERSLKLSLEYDLEEHAARAYTNLACEMILKRRYALGKRYLDEGIAYADDHDLDSWRFYMEGWQARHHLEQGRWVEAEAAATHVLEYNPDGAAAIRLPALLALALLYVRQGRPEADELLDEAQTLVGPTGELQRIAPLVVARAEAAWLAGDHERVEQVALAVYQQAVNDERAWACGCLGYWLWRVGSVAALPDSAEQSYRLQTAGQWRAAASLWAGWGCPYEQAMALAEGDAGAQQTALSIFEQLGAEPAADLLRQQMRSEGVSIPRGPQRQTQANPESLTDRQMDVLALLTEGLTDSEIAQRLFISPKTAGHHVSAILNKLDVRSRHEAALLAVQRGWIDDDGDDVAENVGSNGA